MTDARFKPSVTVAAVIEHRGLYLLVEEETPEGLCLNNPAGHLEQGESLLEAVRREALEETGRAFEPQALVGVYLSRFQRPASGQDVSYLRLAFCGAVSEPIAGRALDVGIVRTIWMHPEEIRATRERHRSPLVLRCLEDHLAGQRFPLSVLHTDPTVQVPQIKTG